MNTRRHTTRLDDQLERLGAAAVMEGVGRGVMDRIATAGRALLLFIDACSFLPQARRSLTAIIRQLEIAGFGSILVLALIAGLTGMIMSFQVGNELAKIGPDATANLGAIIGATFCREMGPLWAGVIVLARVGASMAAELGTMAVNEEVDALRMMNISPVRYLVMPRILALVIAMPLLTTIADWVGLMGGAMIAKAQFDISLTTFMSSAQDFLKGADFFSGLFKSAVFGAIIGTIACDRGLNTTGGAEGVGRSTTDSVVLNVIFILLADFVLTALINQVVGSGATGV